jgi:hypothetical protein
MPLALLSCLPTVTAMPEVQPFPDISFKVFSDFVNQNFSSQVSLATVLLVLFSLTENSDLLNLHNRQKHPYILGERKETASGWIKTLARAIEDHLGAAAKTLLKRKEIPQVLDDNAFVAPIATKLDIMAGVLKLKPIFSKSGKIKHKLKLISHDSITAVHIICPASFECEDTNCQPLALYQDTRLRDIAKVTLIKGTTIHKQVYVLTGKCGSCNTRYHADHEGLVLPSGTRNRLYLNAAKYLKIGQKVWVDRTFSNAVVNGMYSFHASAAAYTEYWNNTFGQVNIDHLARLNRRHIWQAFVQESIRSIAANQNVYLELNEDLPIHDVSRGAFAALGHNGIIHAATGHACSECTQPYRPPANSNQNDMDTDNADVRMHVVDGIVMGPTHCAYPDCEADLLNARGGAFCAVHEREYGSKCRIVGCQNNKVFPTQACQLHKKEWTKHIQNRSPGALAGVRRMLRRPAENLEWLPNVEHESIPHDGPTPPERQNKHYFSPNRFYCVETICAPCGTIIAWTKFARAESPSNILRFLNSVYPNQDMRPDYICIDKACVVLKHIVASHAYEDWFKTTRFIVDSYHYTNHKATDEICRTWCNPAPTDDSAPNLVVPTTDKHGNPCYKRAFNTQACEQLNSWLGGYESILKRMTPGNFNWFLHAMLYYHTQHVLRKQDLQKEKAQRGVQEDISDDNQNTDSDDDI